MSKILLIQPHENIKANRHTNNLTMPLGLIYIGSMLKHHGHNVRIFDRNRSSSDNFLKNLLKKEYDFVGISSYTGKMLYDSIHVSKIVKGNSNSIVVWGSFHPTSVPETTIKEPFVDHIIRGEAEDVFLEMINLHEKRKDFSKLKSVDLNPPAPCPDIDKLPQIDYSLIDVNKYPNFYISTSRGCPYRCTFCYNSYGSQSMQPYRSLSFEKSMNLIESLVSKYKKRTFTIVDDNFPSDRKRLKKMSYEMKKLDTRFDICCRANYTDMETLSHLKRAGCWQMQIGIESGSQKILNFLKKGTTVKMNAEAIKNCRKAGILSHCSFMIGIPTETIEDLKLTEKFIQTHKPDLGGAGIYYPFPKTKLWDYCKEKGFIKEPKTTEEWADISPYGFGEVKIKVSEIPEKILWDYHVKLNKMINKGRDFKKLLLYIRNKRIPDYRRVIPAIKLKLKG